MVMTTSFWLFRMYERFGAVGCKPDADNQELASNEKPVSK
jgi:hypothetical protein